MAENGNIENLNGPRPDDKYQIAPYKFEFEVDPLFRNNVAFSLSYLIATDYVYENGTIKQGVGIEKGTLSLPLNIVDTDGGLKTPEEVALFNQSEQVKEYLILIRQLFLELRNASEKILEDKIEKGILSKDKKES